MTQALRLLNFLPYSCVCVCVCVSVLGVYLGARACTRAAHSNLKPTTQVLVLQACTTILSFLVSRHKAQFSIWLYSLFPLKFIHISITSGRDKVLFSSGLSLTCTSRQPRFPIKVHFLSSSFHGYLTGQRGRGNVFTGKDTVNCPCEKQMFSIEWRIGSKCRFWDSNFLGQNTKYTTYFFFK